MRTFLFLAKTEWFWSVFMGLEGSGGSQAPKRFISFEEPVSTLQTRTEKGGPNGTKRSADYDAILLIEREHLK